MPPRAVALNQIAALVCPTKMTANQSGSEFQFITHINEHTNQTGAEYKRLNLAASISVSNNPR
jgi:hypothetical protein